MKIHELKVLLRGEDAVLKEGERAEAAFADPWNSGFMKDFAKVLAMDTEGICFAREIDGIESDLREVYRTLKADERFGREIEEALRELFEDLEREMMLLCRLFHRIAELDVRTCLRTSGEVPECIEELIETVYEEACWYRPEDVREAYFAYLCLEIFNRQMHMEELCAVRQSMYNMLSDWMERILGRNTALEEMLDDAYNRYELLMEQLAGKVYEEGIHTALRLYEERDAAADLLWLEASSEMYC